MNTCTCSKKQSGNELTYDPDDECVAGEGDEREDGVDDAEEDDDGGMVRLVRLHLVLVSAEE